MYVIPIQFQQFTNREDFISFVQLADDDVNVPLNLTGTVLANPIAPFTSNAWTVMDGPIITTSSTLLTIPIPPIGNQLSALTLTIPPNLGIIPGDPISIRDTATGLNSFTGYVTSYTLSSGALTCQVGWTFQFEIRTVVPDIPGSGYTIWWDFGATVNQGPILQATLANYLSIVDIGTILIRIPEVIFKTVLDVPFNSQNSTFAATLAACMTGTDGADTRQFFVGRLPVLYGGVTT